jgi:hypothetical protein
VKRLSTTRPPRSRLTVAARIEIDRAQADDDGVNEPNVDARRHFTRDDDGLAQPWHGRVYMNPPYGRQIDTWVAKLVTEYRAGHTTAAVALLPARPDTQWFRRLRPFDVCFIWGRLKFNGCDNSAPFPSMLVYLGTNQRRFEQAFKNMGDFWWRHGGPERVVRAAP